MGGFHIFGLILVMTTFVGGERRIFCDDENIDIKCSDGLVFVPRNVFYGRRSDNVCLEGNGATDQICSHHDAFEQVAVYCFNKTICSIPKVNFTRVFEVPQGCEGVSIYAEVVYTCVSPASLHSVCSGKGILEDDYGIGVSPNFPQQYGYDMGCTIKVKAKFQQGMRVGIRVMIHYANMEYRKNYENEKSNGEDCNDFVIFMQNGLRWYKKYCYLAGRNDADFTRSVSSENEYLIVEFESGDSPSIRGFLFEYQVFSCPEGDLPPSPQHGYAVNNGMTVEYGCNYGFYMDPPGQNKVECTVNSWNGQPGVCTRETTTSPTTTSTTLPTTISSSTTSPTTTSTTVSPTTILMTSSTTTIPMTSSTTTTPMTSSTTTTTSTTKTSTAAPTTSTAAPTSTTSPTTSSPSTSKPTTSSPSTSHPTSTLTSTLASTSTAPLTSSTSASPGVTSTSTRITSESTAQTPSTTSFSTSTISPIPSTTTIPSTSSTPTSTSKQFPTTATSSSSRHTSSTTKSSTTTIIVAPATVGSLGLWEKLGIGIGGGIITIALLILIIIVSYQNYKRRNKEKHKKEGLASLRPSKHACVSIPNTYAGTGFSPPVKGSTTSISSDMTLIPRSDGDGHEIRNSDLSYESSIYDMGSGTRLNGTPNGVMNGTPNGTLNIVPPAHYGPIQNGMEYPRDPYGEDMYGSGSGLIENEIYPSALDTIIEEPVIIAGANTEESSVDYDDDDESTIQGSVITVISGSVVPESVATGSVVTGSVITESAATDSVVTGSVATDSYVTDSFATGSIVTGSEATESVVDDSNVDSVSYQTDSTFSNSTVTNASVMTDTPRPSSLEDTKKERMKRRPPKVNYPLFKTDETGNLRNYLDDRRVSV